MTKSKSEIIGVEIKPLKSFPDGRGFFREVFRESESIFDAGHFAQWSHSKMQQDVVKAWHYHHKQTDWWYVPIGEVQVVLYDNREESPTYGTKLMIKAGESDLYKNTQEVCIKIPPGVLHACQVLSKVAHLFYITSETYDPDDEGRIAFDSKEVPHEWTCKPITSEKDRVDFVPKYQRRELAS